MIDFFRVIKERRSIRNFIKAKIPRSDLRKIVDAGRLAPCGGNRQAWHFIVIINKKIISKILIYLELSKMLVDLKRAKGPYDVKKSISFSNTSSIIAIAVDVKQPFYKEDGSAAAENMLLAITALGYGGCWVHGQVTLFLKAIEKLLNTPRNLRLFTMIILGKPERHPKRPRKKKLEEILHWDNF